MHATSDAAVHKKQKGMAKEHSVLYTWTDKPDFLRIEFEPNLKSTDSAVLERARRLNDKLQCKGVEFRLRFDVNSGYIELDVCDGRNDPAPFRVLPMSDAKCRLHGVFQPLDWAHSTVVYLREDRGWFSLQLAKAILGMEAVQFEDGGRTGGMTIPVEKRPHVLILHLTDSFEDRIVVEAMVDAQHNLAGSKFIHVQHVSMDELKQMVTTWSQDPGNPALMPVFIQQWLAKLDTGSFDPKTRRRVNAIYIPPVVCIFAHGSKDKELQDSLFSSGDEFSQQFEFQELVTLLQLLLNAHIPPLVFAFFTCYGAGQSAASVPDSLVCCLATALHPMPFLAYSDEVSFEDLLIGHPFVFLRMVGMLFDPVRALDETDPLDCLMWQSITSDPISPILRAFQIARSQLLAKAATKAVFFNNVHAGQAINRDKLWEWWKVQQDTNLHEGKTTWYSVMKATKKDGAGIVREVEEAPYEIVQTDPKTQPLKLVEGIQAEIDTFIAAQYHVVAQRLTSEAERIEAKDPKKALSLFKLSAKRTVNNGLHPKVWQAHARALMGIYRCTADPTEQKQRREELHTLFQTLAKASSLKSERSVIKSLHQACALEWISPSLRRLDDALSHMDPSRAQASSSTVPTDDDVFDLLQFVNSEFVKLVRCDLPNKVDYERQVEKYQQWYEDLTTPSASNASVQMIHPSTGDGSDEYVKRGDILKQGNIEKHIAEYFQATPLDQLFDVRDGRTLTSAVRGEFHMDLLPNKAADVNAVVESAGGSSDRFFHLEVQKANSGKGATWFAASVDSAARDDASREMCRTALISVMKAYIDKYRELENKSGRNNNYTYPDKPVICVTSRNGAVEVHTLANITKFKEWIESHKQAFLSADIANAAAPAAAAAAAAAAAPSAKKPTEKEKRALEFQQKHEPSD